MKPAVYLAGPDVFYPDARERGDFLKTLCVHYGFVGLFPLDNEIAHGAPLSMARAIRDANMELIRKADAVIANLEPFRGFEPDSGTVFEVGYAVALGKRVIGYAPDVRTMKDRLCAHLSLPPDAVCDPDGLAIEEFGLSHNLMFGELVCARSAEEALEMLSREI